ncbi:hypothetical protein Cpin_6867 [Chitinophaga pinensis DSM 2588]|uniref:Uncharacterized protein n=1 Tax=Chitinophaga pinensis (strain ATCC 43595 / DSM 2588 / LMG 13176 / NBRC 15968 / NCIMB 11800 / UQM 2034) TaxID=485918 RepID=A0A979GBE4_CHIPD|nr:hypothetical protein Cpin_6867 [Chitinophaga pinensis DSM 2588]
MYASFSANHLSPVYTYVNSQKATICTDYAHYPHHETRSHCWKYTYIFVAYPYYAVITPIFLRSGTDKYGHNNGVMTV